MVFEDSTLSHKSVTTEMERAFAMAIKVGRLTFVFFVSILLHMGWYYINCSSNEVFARSEITKRILKCEQLEGRYS